MLCATRGEAGDPTSVVVAGPGELGVLREQEPRDAADLLGVSEIAVLDFHDSDMAGPTPPDTLVGAPFAEVVDQVRTSIERFRPDIVLTLDAGDGHRDHARIRDATIAAVEASSVPVGRLYLQCLATSIMKRWIAHLTATNPDAGHLTIDVPGTPDELITTSIDTAAHLAVRERAMAAHASQSSPYDGLPDDLRRDTLTVDRLRRLVPPWTGGPVERDLV